MLRILRRLALLTVCAATLSVPALARDHWRGRSSVTVVVNGHDGYWRDGYWVPAYRVHPCDLPPDLAWRYGCYSRPVVVVPRYHYYRRSYYYRPYYYRPRSGVSFSFRVH